MPKLDVFNCGQLNTTVRPITHYRSVSTICLFYGFLHHSLFTYLGCEKNSIFKTKVSNEKLCENPETHAKNM